MDRKQSQASYFFCADKMGKICPCIISAYKTAARRIERLHITLKFCLRKIKRTPLCKCDASPRVMRRHNAIKKIYAFFYNHLNVVKMPDSQKMPWFFWVKF